MRTRLYAIAWIAVALTFCCAPAPAGEITRHIVQLAVQQSGNGLPKGSYQQSCTCQVSGGVTLMCFCNNLQGKMFETQIDVRNCALPKDIRNCNGKLTCVDPKSADAC